MPVSLEEFDAWLKESGPSVPAVTQDDVDKVATIKDAVFKDTKYGRRLLVTLQFDDGSEKVIFLSRSKGKTLAAAFAQRDPQLANPEKWIGQKVKVISVNVFVGGEIRNTLMLTPA